MTAANGATGPAPATTTPTGPAPADPQASNNPPAAPPGHATGPAPATPPAAPASPADDRPSAEEWQKVKTEFAEAKRDAAKYREEKRLADEAKLSDLERLAKRAEAAEQLAAQRLERAIASDIKLAAQGLAFHDPADAVDRVLPQVRDIADEGERDKAIAKALGELVKAKPYLVAATGGQPGQQPGQPPQRPPANSGPTMSPARGQAQPAQSITNRPLRGWDAVNWKP